MKKIMTQSRSLLATLLLAVGIAGIQPKPAQSMMLVMGTNEFLTYGNNMFTDWDMSEVYMCVLLLPICLLNREDSKVSMAQQRSKQFLVESGYSPRLAENFVKQGQRLLKNAAAKRTKLVVAKNDTPAMLERDIYTLYPAASKEFVQFYVRQLLGK